eukprot:COSAG01_NODE_7547_length_3156_cov_20.612692_1_plen_182_part_00
MNIYISTRKVPQILVYCKRRQALEKATATTGTPRQLTMDSSQRGTCPALLYAAQTRMHAGADYEGGGTSYPTPRPRRCACMLPAIYGRGGPNWQPTAGRTCMGRRRPEVAPQAPSRFGVDGSPSAPINHQTVKAPAPYTTHHTILVNLYRGRLVVHACMASRCHRIYLSRLSLTSQVSLGS